MIQKQIREMPWTHRCGKECQTFAEYSEHLKICTEINMQESQIERPDYGQNHKEVEEIFFNQAKHKRRD